MSEPVELAFSESVFDGNSQVDLERLVFIAGACSALGGGPGLQVFFLVAAWFVWLRTRPDRVIS